VPSAISPDGRRCGRRYSATTDPAQQQSLVDYYTKQFAPEENKVSGEQVDVDALLPTANAQRYLQALYTASFDDFDAAIKFDDARDGSAWSAANARFNDFFCEIVTRFEFEDALLLDTQRHEPQPRDQGGTAGRAAPRERPADVVPDA
jgi:N-acyl-D-aspartate/D-glutamate deacylase